MFVPLRIAIDFLILDKRLNHPMNLTYLNPWFAELNAIDELLNILIFPFVP